MYSQVGISRTSLSSASGNGNTSDIFLLDIINTAKKSSLMSDVPVPSRRRRLNCNIPKICQSYRLKICLAILMLYYASRSTALMCPSRQHAYLMTHLRLSTLYTSMHNTNMGTKLTPHRCRQNAVSLNIRGKGDDDIIYDDKKDHDTDNKNVDYEDDLDADAYLEHLISDAMKEEISTNQRKTPREKTTTSTNTLDNVASLDDTKRMIEQQQQQIDLLMKMVQSQQQPKSSGNHQNIVQEKPVIVKQEKALNVTPLKIMFFIDGTWLYYSMHARKDDRCTVTRKFGKGWQANYKVDW